MEQEVLRAADRHRRNAEKLDTNLILRNMQMVIDKEINALSVLQKMFSWWYTGVKVSDNGKEKKTALRAFLIEYKTAAKASRAKTLEILNKLV